MLTPVTKTHARNDTIKRVPLTLAVVLFGLAPSLPAYALPTSDYNTSCATTGITEAADGTANNLICNGSNKWQYPSYIIGSTGAGGTAITCSATTAGAVQWTGSILQYCSGTAWVTVEGSGSTSGIYLGTSASYTNPQKNTDITTGLYSANTGEVDVASGGNQITQTTASGFNVVIGSVGIGTTSPTRALDVAGSSSGTTLTTASQAAVGILNMNTTNGNYADLAFQTYDTSSAITLGAKISAVFNSHTPSAVSADLAFLTKNAGTTSEKMRITAAGNVGIGTTLPAVSLDLDTRSDAIALPRGGSSLRPTAALINGEIRYNSDLSAVEYWNGSTWVSLEASGSSSGVYLGASASATNPQNSSNAGTGLYSAGTTEVDVAEGSTQVASFTSSGINIATGSLKLASQNGISFPPDYTTDASIAIGSGALAYQAIGIGTQGNLAVGYQALGNSGLTTAAVKNTALGYLAGSQITSGYNNTIVGAQVASTTLSTGNSNILIGVGSAGVAGGAGVSSASISNYLNIGNTLEGSTQYATAIGSETLYLNSVTGSVNYVKLSGGATGTGPTIAAAGGDTNVNLTLSPAGTGNTLIPTGSVGIGTATPAAALTIVGSNGSTSGNANFQLYDSNGVKRTVVAGSGIQYWYLNSGGSEVGIIQYSTPGNLPGIVFSTTSFTGRSQISQLASTGGLAFSTTTGSTAPTAQMVLTTAGSVGIGTTAPVVSLDLSKETDAIALPSGASSVRPVSTALANGEIRYNTGLSAVEYYNGSAWASLENSGSTSGVYLGTSASYTNPQKSTDITTGLYSANTGEVDVASAGSQIISWTSSGENIVTGSLKIAGVNGLSFPPDYLTNSSIAVGSGALAYQPLGTAGTNQQNNTAIGYLAMSNSGLTATALQNTAIGAIAMVSFTSGLGNTAVGRGSLSSLSIGTENTSMGFKSLNLNSTGSGNTAVGTFALGNNSGSVGTNTGNFNTALGWDAGGGGNANASGVTSGGYNTMLGYNVASTTLATGNSNILIGVGSTSVAGGADTPASSTSNYLNIGNTLEGSTQYATAIGSETLYLNSVSGSVNYVKLSGGATGTGPTIAAAGGDTNVNLTLSPAGNGNTLIPTGSVGIGTSSPDSPLHIVSGTIGASTYGVHLSATGTNATAIETGLYANNNATLSSAPSSAYAAVGINGIGLTNSANANGNTTVTGMAGYGQYAGTATLGNAYGLSFAAQNLSTGTITNADGMYGYVKNSSTGTITNAIGINAFINNASTGTIAKAYGLYIQSPANSGTITNTYGLYIVSQTAATQTNTPYAFYQAGSTDRNYFAGSVGIGSTSPVVSLDLSKQSDAIALPSGASSARPVSTALANGEIRYNTGNSTVEFYNGSTWVSLANGGSGTGIANYTARWTTATALGTGILYDNGTQVGIGTATPATNATLDVTGAIYSRSVNAAAATTLNWASGNEQYTTASCGAFSFSGMVDGGSYTLLVEGTTSGTCSFTNSDSPTLTFRLPTNHGATTSGTMTLYHFTRLGTYVIATWMPGYSP